ncbi:MAG: ATP-binding protein [Anaerolineae bacterium]
MTIDESQMYQALYQLSRRLQQDTLNVPDVIQIVLTEAKRITGATQCCALMFDQEGHVQRVYTPDNSVAPELWRSIAEQGAAGFVYFAQRTVIIRNMTTDPRWVIKADMPDFLRSGSAIGLPFKRGGIVYGVLLLVHPRVDYFRQPMEHILEEVLDLSSATVNQILDRQGVLVSQDRYQISFSDAVVPMLLTDLNGKILGANRRANELLGYPRSGLINRDIQDTHRLNLAALEQISIGEEITQRTKAVAIDGHEIPVILRVRRLLVENHDVLEWVVQDITKQMEYEQLRHDLSAMIYHDLRNPLQGIRGSIQKLAELLANTDDAVIHRLLQIGVRSTRQLIRMVDSLLDLQRLEEGQGILKRQTMPLTSILADASQLVQPLALEAHQHLQFDIQKDLPTVTLDADMIVRVVVNLLENAIKYTPNGGSITLASYVEGNQVFISVIDSGPGIPKDFQTNIFDKFNRVKYDNVPNGVGLGLTFCRLAVKAHGGDIWVESEPGQGAKFIFTLPLGELEEDSPENSARIVAMASTA